MARVRSYSTRAGLAAGILPYRYELIPYTWITSDIKNHWRLPLSAVGGVDLRSLPAQAASGGAPQGYGFAACRQSPGGVSLTTSFHMSETSATTAMRSAWLSATGYQPAGATLTDLLWDQLTTGSDPDGLAGPKPLLPGADSVLRLLVGGHSEVKAEAFHWGRHPHTNRVRDVLRRDFQRLWEGTDGDDSSRRVLDFWSKQYRAEWSEFVPPTLRAHVPGPLPHETTITESFNKADSDTLGPDLSWTELEGDWDVVGNEAEVQSSGIYSVARADSNLSSADHYSQSVVRAVGDLIFGMIARKDSTATATWYYLEIDDRAGFDAWQLLKNEAGSYTAIGSAGSGSLSLGDVVKLECNGSTIKGYQGATERVSVTDTAITGNLRCGIQSYFGGSYTVQTRLDSFQAADLAAETKVMYQPWQQRGPILAH